jgi:4a-hydroxytetrahydrobiopterin dehydratase
MMIAGAIAHLAELAWHHPDLIVTYPRVTVRLTTHDAGGISDYDFALARRIEALVGWRPTDDGLPGLPAGPAHRYLA